MRERAVNKRMMLGAVGALVIVLLAWVGYLIYKRPGNPGERSGGGSAAASQWAAANVRPATLFECYEHARENVPPRNDTGVRQRNWQAPPMPLEVIRAAVNDKSSAEERELLGWMEKWDANYRAGRPIDPAWQMSLRAILERTRLPFEVLFKLGSAMGFLEHENVAAIFYRAALRTAQEEYKNISPLDPRAGMLRAALPQMGMLWTIGDYPALEQRFALEMRLYAPLSQEGRKCAHSCAEAMYYQGKSKEAAELIATVMQRHEQAADLNQSDREEMGWIEGIFYSGNQRYKEAIPGLIIACSSGGNRALNASQMLGMCIARLPAAEIDEQMKEVEKSKLTAEQKLSVRRTVTMTQDRLNARQVR